MKGSRLAAVGRQAFLPSSPAESTDLSRGRWTSPKSKVRSELPLDSIVYLSTPSRCRTTPLNSPAHPRRSPAYIMAIKQLRQARFLALYMCGGWKRQGNRKVDTLSVPYLLTTWPMVPRSNCSLNAYLQVPALSICTVRPPTLRITGPDQSTSTSLRPSTSLSLYISLRFSMDLHNCPRRYLAGSPDFPTVRERKKKSQAEHGFGRSR